jgi:LacI family transcriptional regulator
MRGATIRDVAREAGVSVATVSRVLNDSGPVNAATRRRIQEVASRLRYAPDGAARSLITRRTHTLGVLLPDIHGEFFSEVIRGIDRAAQASGFHVLVSSSHNERSEIEAALRTMRGRVDGLVVMSPDVDAAALVANLPESTPVVLVNCNVRDAAFHEIDVDNAGGARAMAEHLLAAGHRRIAFVRGPDRNVDAADRLAGYRAALQAAGVERRGEWELAGDFTDTRGYRAVTELLALDPRPTALMCANDSTAIGALSALREAGVRVPEEVAVTGFDDIPIARYVSPALTTVHVDIAGLGARATQALLRAIEQKNDHERGRELVATTLAIRESCGTRSPLRASGGAEA